MYANVNDNPLLKKIKGFNKLYFRFNTFQEFSAFALKFHFKHVKMLIQEIYISTDISKSTSFYT